jgi:hypothetical protein
LPITWRPLPLYHFPKVSNPVNYPHFVKCVGLTPIVFQLLTDAHDLFMTSQDRTPIFFRGFKLAKYNRFPIDSRRSSPRLLFIPSKTHFP